MGLLVTTQPVGQAIPTGALPVRVKNGSEQRFHAARPHQHPRRFRLEPAPIHRCKPPVEVIVAYEYRELGTASCFNGTA